MLFGSMAWEFLFCGGGMILFAIVFKDLAASYFFFLAWCFGGFGVHCSDELGHWLMARTRMHRAPFS